MEEKRESLNQLIEGLNSIIIGKEEAIDLVVVSLLAGGHILLEDIPGVGKTTLAKGIAKLTGCSFGRISFTPDTLPSDITGYSIYNPQKGEFTFSQGIIMNQIILGDEINRTSPKTQAALLEAMEEAQVTVDGKTYPLPSPFLVIATQNPTDFLGTYRLPEAQMDRFFIRISLGYPKREQETAMIDKYVGGKKWDEITPVIKPEDLCLMQKEVNQVTVHEDLIQYMLDIVELTRNHEYITLGISPRGSLSLVKGAMAMAYLRGRNYVIPEDIVSILVPVLAHRIIISSSAKINKMTSQKVIMALKNQVKVPVLWEENMWQTRIICLVLLILSGVFASYYGGVIPYTLFYFFIMIPVVSFLYTFYVFLRFRIYQSVEQKTLVKRQVSDYQYQIVNEDWVNYESIRVNFFDDFSTIMDADNKEYHYLLPGTSVSRKTTLCCNYRGHYHVGIKSVEIQDFLHLFKITYPLLTKFHVTVLPRLLEVDQISFLSWNKDSKVNFEFLNGGERERTSEVRCYTQGDDKRLIHWKASAKLNKLFVRKTDPIPRPELTIFMDTTYNDREDNYIIYDQLIECVLSILLFSITKEQVRCSLVYKSQDTCFLDMTNIVELEEFYQTTSNFAFRERSSFSEFVKENIVERGNSSQVVIVTQKLEKEYLDLGIECMKLGVLLSVLCVEEKTEWIKEMIPFYHDAGIHLVVMEPTDDVKSVLEKGMEL